MWRAKTPLTSTPQPLGQLWSVPPAGWCMSTGNWPNRAGQQGTAKAEQVSMADQ